MFLLLYVHTSFSTTFTFLFWLHFTASLSLNFSIGFINHILFFAIVKHVFEGNIVASS